MRRKMVSSVAMVLALATGIAACGDDDDDGGSASTASESSTGGTGSTGETKELKIATVAYSQFFGSLTDGVEIRLELANDSGEVPGYTFDYIGLIDDQFTPEGTVAAFRKAKEQDGVFAVIGNQSPAPPTEYVNEQKLPVISWGTTDNYCTHGSTQTWYWFSITGCGAPVNATYGFNLGEPAGELMGNTAGKTAACIGEDYPNNVENMKKLCASFEAAGIEVVLTDASIPAPPAVTSSWSPFVQKLMTANDGKPVDVIGLGTGPQGAAGLVPALVQAGYKGMMIYGVGPAPEQTQVLKGVTAWSNFATPYSTTDNPEMAKIVDSFKAAGIAADAISGTALSGWLAADMFVKIAKEAGADLTAESFAEAAKTFTYELEGVAGPTVYPKAFAGPTPCSELTQSDGTTWKVVRPYTCDHVFNVKDGTLDDYDDIDPDLQY